MSNEQTAQNGAVHQNDLPSPVPQPQAGNTLLDPGGAAQQSPPWPDDWRTQLAGPDKGYLKTLDRYATPNDYFKRTRSLERMVSSGQDRRPLPESASAQELADWRADQGIPAQPQDYAIELPDGVVLGEADKPVVESFTRDAHANNWSNAQVNQALAWYYAEQDLQRAVQEDFDVQFKAQSEADLRVQWQGADYRRNLSAVNNLLASMPEQLAMKLLAGRSPDGRKFGDDPALDPVARAHPERTQSERHPVTGGRRHRRQGRRRPHARSASDDGRPQFGLLERAEGRPITAGISRPGRDAAAEQDGQRVGQ